MPIRYTEPGTHELHATLGKKVADYRANQQAVARQDAMASQARNMQHDYDMRLLSDELAKATEKRAVEWEFQKMEMNSMKDFERKQMELDFWNMKKVQHESEQLDKYSQAVELIDSDDTIPAQQKPELLRRLKLKYLGMDIMPKQKAEDPMQQLMMQAMGQQGIQGQGMMGSMQVPQQAPQQAPQMAAPQTVKKWNIKTVKGMQVIEKGGVTYKVVGMDSDGTPLVEPLNPQALPQQTTPTRNLPPGQNYPDPYTSGEFF